MNELSDNELVKAANSGQATAFAVLLERHYDLIYRIAYRTLANQQDAEDIAQDICVSLPKKLLTFKGKSKLTTWLYQITLNQCRDAIRKNSSIQRVMADFSEIYELQHGHNEEQQKILAWAYNAIDCLTEPWRETAILVVAEGLTHAAVSYTHLTLPTTSRV